MRHDGLLEVAILKVEVPIVRPWKGKLHLHSLWCPQIGVSRSPEEGKEVGHLFGEGGWRRSPIGLWGIGSNSRRASGTSVRAAENDELQDTRIGDGEPRVEPLKSTLVSTQDSSRWIGTEWECAKCRVTRDGLHLNLCRPISFLG